MNLIDLIAEELQVNIEEIFELYNKNGKLGEFKFSENCLKYRFGRSGNNNDWVRDSKALGLLVEGLYFIKSE